MLNYKQVHTHPFPSPIAERLQAFSFEFVVRDATIPGGEEFFTSGSFTLITAHCLRFCKLICLAKYYGNSANPVSATDL